MNILSITRMRLWIPALMAAALGLVLFYALAFQRTVVNAVSSAEMNEQASKIQVKLSALEAEETVLASAVTLERAGQLGFVDDGLLTFIPLDKTPAVLSVGLGLTYVPN